MEGYKAMTRFEIGFNVDVVDGWPPVAVEFLWFSPVPDGLELLNQPFFVKDISVGDVFLIDVEKKDGQIFCLNWKFVRKSERSTVEFLVDEGINVDAWVERIKSKGGEVAVLEKYNLYSLDLPGGVDVSILDEMEDFLGDAVEIIYPSYRMDE